MVFLQFFSFIQQGSSFIQALSLCSIQFCGFVKNAELPPLADDLEAPRPNVMYIDDKGKKHLDCLTLCAGQSFTVYIFLNFLFNFLFFFCFVLFCFWLFTEKNLYFIGLPHFASGFARNWGRDTFIAIRGNLMLTGRFQDAR